MKREISFDLSANEFKLCMFADRNGSKAIVSAVNNRFVIVTAFLIINVVSYFGNNR